MAARTPNLPRPLDKILEYKSFLTILRYYVDLNCFVIPSDPGFFEWLAIHYHQRADSLFDFEKKYNFKFNWDKLRDPDYERGKGKGQPLLLETLGFYDIFMPIRRRGKRLGTILSGAFADREVTYSLLRESWGRLTGQSASPENGEFRQFVRVMLEAPVLEGPTLLAYREALELYAGVLVDQNKPEAFRRWEELLTRVFSKQVPHSYFMDWALGLPTRQTAPIWDRGIQEMPWVRSEIGLSRVPTTVITAIPLDVGGRRHDAVEDMLRIYRFQRRSFHFAQTLPQTVGGKLENYGAVFVTSADPSLSRPQRRRKILEAAEQIHHFATKELGGPALVGIGVTVAPGESLNESYRQALLGLHLGRGAGKEVVFFGSVHAEKSVGILEIMRLSEKLKRLVETASSADLGSALDGFLNQVLTLSMHNPEEIRWHLQYGLIQMKDAVEKRLFAGKEEASKLHENLVLSLEKAGTTQEIILAFKDALEKLLFLAQGGVALKTAFSMERVRDYLDQHFREPLRAEKIAKLADVSVATLSRHFKKSAGVGLEIYLQNLRIEEAKRLLKTGSLPVFQVAQSCGFKSASHFARFFRRKTGSSPEEFRKKSH